MTHADLEAVDYQYMLCGLSDGGVAVYDVSTIQEGRIYSEVASIKGGHRGGHKHSVGSIDIISLMFCNKLHLTIGIRNLYI